MGIPSESEPSVTAFPHLFSPVRVGSVTVKNRIVSSGHDTVMAEDGRSVTASSRTTRRALRAASD